MLLFKVYAIYNEERDKIYVGYTSDLEKRLLRHNNILKNKITSFTSRNSGLWRLIYSESFYERKDAMRREKELKSCQGRNFLKSLLKK